MKDQYIEQIKKVIENMTEKDLRFFAKLAELRAGKPNQE